MVTILIMLVLVSAALIGEAAERLGFFFRRNKYIKQYSKDDPIFFMDELCDKKAHRYLWTSPLFTILGIYCFVLFIHTISSTYSKNIDEIAIYTLGGLALLLFIWIGISNGIYRCDQEIKKADNECDNDGE